MKPSNKSLLLGPLVTIVLIACCEKQAIIPVVHGADTDDLWVD
ncbi:MAG: hypothetical protein A4E65_01721 [Syntrophorhabdus sp. PtaU1.Bin153]|nr:MAG: hypothetical protein A4E65_01721 [Syntrophorhabdus sp. PtaU1.Bin153]